MQPARVYGGVVQRRHHGHVGPIRPHRHVPSSTASVPIQPLIPRVQPYNLQEAMITRAVSRTRPLLQSPWNGHIEVTDECRLGLALFQITSPKRVIKHIDVPFKDGTRSKRVEIHLVDEYSNINTYLLRRNPTITITDLMLRHMEDQCLQVYLTEFTLVSQLLDKIHRVESVRDRWIPTFSPSLRSLSTLLNEELEEAFAGVCFDINGGYIFTPKTLGQWFLKLLLERVRRHVTKGIGLRTLIYCVCWCARLIEERDYERLSASATMIKAWLLQGTCQDCVYKFLRELRSDLSFEYSLNIADSFSEFISLPELRTGVKVGECSETGILVLNQPGFLRTFGQHSFLTSPYANTSLPVRVKLVEGEPPKVFQMTGRQTATLLSMLDIHARVIRARNWNQCSRAFNACLRERRANSDESLMLVMSQMIEDLFALSELSSGLSTTIAHFAALIFCGRLSAEMLSAYQQAKNSENPSAHTFIVKYCFLRAPTPDTQAFADATFKKFLETDGHERMELLKYSLENETHNYEFSREEIDIQKRWDIVDSKPEDDLVNEFFGEAMTFTNRTTRWEEDTRLPAVIAGPSRNLKTDD